MVYLILVADLNARFVHPVYTKWIPNRQACSTGRREKKF